MIAASFAQETRSQRAKHNEIDVRYRNGRVERLTPLRGRMLRRRRELVDVGRWRVSNDRDWKPDPTSWAEVFADVLMFSEGDATDLMSLAYDAGVTIDYRTAQSAIADATPCALPSR